MIMIAGIPFPDQGSFSRVRKLVSMIRPDNHRARAGTYPAAFRAFTTCTQIERTACAKEIGSMRARNKQPNQRREKALVCAENADLK